MNKDKSKRRIGIVDLMRFMACIFIAWYHSSYIRYENNTLSFHFTGAFIFVELFMILTGYFTVKHFTDSKYMKKKLDEKCITSIKYTWDKYKIFLPYTIIAVLLMYLIRFINVDFHSYTEIILFFKSFLQELLLLNIKGGGILGLTWYLAAILSIYPLFCFLCQSKYRSFLLLLIFPFCLIYYSLFSTFSSNDSYTLIRATAGLSLGAIVFLISNYLSKINFKKIWLFLFSLIEISCFLISIILLYTNDHSLVMSDRSYSFSIIILFIIMLSLLLSGKTIQSKIHFWLFDFLGKISLQFYLFHLIICEIIYLYLNTLPLMTKMIFLYVGTFIVSISVYSMVELAKIKLPSIKYIFINKN